MTAALDTNPVRTAAALLELRQDDHQRAPVDGGRGVFDIEGAVDTHGAGEASELAFHQVIRLFFGCRRWCLFAGHEQNVAAEQHAQRLRRNAGHVEDDLERAFGFADVNRRMTFAGERAVFVLERGGELGEQLLNVVGQIARFGGGEKENATADYDGGFSASNVKGLEELSQRAPRVRMSPAPRTPRAPCPPPAPRCR